MLPHSFHRHVLVASNAELELPDAALQANEVLLELGLLLLEASNLVLQFHILNFLSVKVLLKVTFNSKIKHQLAWHQSHILLTWWLRAGVSCELRWTCVRARSPTALFLGEASAPRVC